MSSKKFKRDHLLSWSYFSRSNLFHSCVGNTPQMPRRHLHSAQAAVPLPEVGIGTRGTGQGEKNRSGSDVTRRFKVMGSKSVPEQTESHRRAAKSGVTQVYYNHSEMR